MSSKKPNMFIVGAPKAGTTSLHAILDQHKQVFMSDPKEVNYFSNDEISSQSLYYEPFMITDESEYLQLFSKAGTSKIVGEASVSYLFYPGVASKIFHFNPKSKILISLRNPVDRAYSHYLMDRRLGFVNVSFEEIVHDALQGKQNLYVQQYIELGNYYNQVKRFLEVFPSDQICILYFNEFKDRMPAIVNELCDFLEIERMDYFNEERQNVHLDPKSKMFGDLYSSKKFRELTKKLMPAKARESLKKTFFKPGKKDVLATDLKEKLNDYYHDDLVALASLLSVDVSKLD